MQQMKSYILCFTLFFMCLSLLAQERQISDVRDEVYSFFQTNGHNNSVVWNLPPQRIRDTMIINPIQRENTTYLYVVNIPSAGWALVSNEQQYESILGYSHGSYFSTDSLDMPEALVCLLQHHMNMIDSLRCYGATIFYNRISTIPHDSASSLYEKGDILLHKNGHEIQWNQSRNNDIFYNSAKKRYEWICDCDISYNKFIPRDYNECCGRAWAGCGAVAMGQLMWYWEWPDYAMIPDTIIWGVPYNPRTAHYYDWKSMPHKIDSTTNIYYVDNIAGLLRDCCYTTNAWFTALGTTATFSNIKKAMSNVFHFHTKRYHEYPKTDMDPIIKREIDSLRPVLCQAWNNDDGLSAHTFVIDGYNIVEGESLYHINFGWGGNYNSWYDLGFYGYDGNRTFLIEVYPDCSARQGNAYNDTDTIIENGGTLTYYSTQSIVLGGIGNELTIKNGGHLIAEAGNMIALIGGFRAEYSSHVRLGIRDFCAETGINIRRAPNITAEIEDEAETNAAEDDIAIKKVKVSEKDAFSTYPNPVVNTLNISSNRQITESIIYNLSGQKVLQTEQTEVDVSGLPDGMYILRAQTTDGYIYQDKFIKAVR